MIKYVVAKFILIMAQSSLKIIKPLLNMKLIMLINVKMPTTIVGILTFMSMINTTSESFIAEKSLFFSILVFMSSWNFMLS